MLSDLQYEVIETGDTDTALQLCQTKQPEVVILDWHIPNSDPIEFIKDLRATFTGRRPYLIYLTTEKDPDVIARAIDAGADDYLLKPFDRAGFVAKFSDMQNAA